MFATAVSYPSHGSTRNLVTGDLNGDGHIDVVLTIENTARAVVYAGNGDGTFTEIGQNALGFGPWVGLVADMNGDGKLDIITSNVTSKSITVLNGNGDATFQAPISTSTSSFIPSGIAVGDVNGDGKLDVVAAASDSSRVMVLTGTGDGNLDAPSFFTASTSSALWLSLGDVNGDGKLDIVVSSFVTSSLSVLTGNGDGTFNSEVTYAVGNSPTSVEMADLNGDGHVDIIVSNYGDNNVGVLLNNGDGTFANQVTYATGSRPFGVTLGDVDGDGKLDMVVANSSADTVSLLFGNGDGTFNPALTYTAQQGSGSVAIADANGDGSKDLLVSNYNAQSFSVLLADPRPVFASASVRDNTLVMTYTGTGLPLDEVNIPAPGDFRVTVAGATIAVTVVAVDGAAGKVTLTLASPVTYGQAVTVAYTDPDAGDSVNAIQSAAQGADAATLAAHTVTNLMPIPDANPIIVTLTPNAPTHTASGLPSVSETIKNTGGGTVSTNLVAATGNGNLVTIDLPGGFSIINQGARVAEDKASALADLAYDIKALKTGNAGEQASFATQWLNSLPSDSLVDIRTLILSGQQSGGGASTLVISGTPAGSGSQLHEAFVLDAKGLPAGSTLQLDNIDFAAINGAVKVTGGKGANFVVADDARQVIFLGAGDDVVHAGGGDDRLSGGAGSDTIDGGTGRDIVRLEGSSWAENSITGPRSKTVVKFGSDTDTLTNVEFVAIGNEIKLLQETAPVLFDEARYLALNPDVAAAVAAGRFASGLQHFQQFGQAEHRNAGADFDADWYLAENPDVVAAIARGEVASAIDHFARYGKFEGRDANPLFDTRYYLQNNPDVAAAIAADAATSAYDHYLAWGAREGRIATAYFDPQKYLAANPDVAAAVAAGYTSAYEHYVTHGAQEGRGGYMVGTTGDTLFS